MRDAYNKLGNFDQWREDIKNPQYIEPELSEINSKNLIDFIIYQERRGRSRRTLMENRNKLKALMRKFQDKGLNDITQATENQLLDFFKELKEQGHTNDYAKRFKAFWNYWRKINRREGKVIADITQDLKSTAPNKTNFVWIKKHEGELDKICEYLTEKEQTIVRFCMDSLVRAPSELINIKVYDIQKKNNGEVWIQIRDEISKTYGRRFNLVYTGDLVLDLIEKEGLKDDDYVFNFSYAYFNRKLQKICEQIWGDKVSEGGEKYKNATLYDLRHSGAIFFRQLFQDTGQSIDTLRHRGGWATLDMINYYTQFLGLTGKIDKEQTLLSEDKTKLEKDVEQLRREIQKKDEKINEVSSNLEKLNNVIEQIKSRYQQQQNIIQDKLNKLD